MGGALGMYPDTDPDMVLALSCGIWGGGAPIIVCDRPDAVGGGPPKMLEKAASRWADEEEAGPWLG